MYECKNTSNQSLINDQKLNSIIKLNFSNTNKFRIGKTEKLNDMASLTLFNKENEYENKIVYLENELYSTECKLNKKIDYFTKNINKILKTTVNFGLTKKD